MQWNDDEVATLKQLWEHGISLSEIGEKLGCSRSAVIGKANRLGFPKRGKRYAAKPAAAKVRKPTKRKLMEKAFNSEPLPELKIAPIVPLNIALFDLTKRQCRYPYGDRAPYLFCGHPVQEESSYCPDHHRICWHRHERKPETKPYVPARGRAA